MPSASERLSVRTTTPAPPVPFAALVTRSDTTGVWVTPEGGDPTRPVGPCRGATRLALGGTAVERLPERTRVLLLPTDSGLWVLAHDMEVT